MHVRRTGSPEVALPDEEVAVCRWPAPSRSGETAPVLLTLSTTHRPATHLGSLLHEDPQRRLQGEEVAA
jgi:hypothetical protein